MHALHCDGFPSDVCIIQYAVTASIPFCVDTANRRNDLESYIYKLRDSYGGSSGQKDEEKGCVRELVAMCEQIGDWLDNVAECEWAVEENPGDEMDSPGRNTSHVSWKEQYMAKLEALQQAEATVRLGVNVK